MADTYSKIYIQVVFAVKGRGSLIQLVWEEELYKYISGIIRNKRQKMLEINGAEDHIHFLIGMKPNCCLSDLIREIKKNSNDFIRQKKFTRTRFEWQDGFAAFSYSHSELNYVINYIRNQKEHHKIVSFKEEYNQLLKEFEIEFEEAHLFEWIN